MPGCSDNEQFNFKLFGKFDDVSHRMPGDDMRILTADRDRRHQHSGSWRRKTPFTQRPG